MVAVLELKHQASQLPGVISYGKWLGVIQKSMGLISLHAPANQLCIKHWEMITEYPKMGGIHKDQQFLIPHLQVPALPRALSR